jgi:HPt (histidine-containing phosphotransfer) domain-containing protein
MRTDENSGLNALNRDAVGELVSVLGAQQTRKILDKFFGDSRGRLVTVEKAVVDQRMADVCSNLHMLKSTAATFGMIDVARLAIEIEAEAKCSIVGQARIAALGASFENAVGGLLAAFPDLA